MDDRKYHRVCRRGALIALCLLLGIGLRRDAPLPVAATGYFWNHAIAQQWQADEAAVPGFWGPLSTSTAIRQEPYANHTADLFCPQGTPIACDAVGGYLGRTVQYFDKGRMEISTPLPRSVTNRAELTDGRLVTEMRDGEIQTGDTIFDPHSPATMPLVGDPGNDGPTYANLAALPTHERDTGVSALPYTFDASTRQWTRLPALPTAIPPAVFAYTRIEDGTGTYGQNVLSAFLDYENRVPSGFAAIGWPISPVFVVDVPVNGVRTALAAQAFERRVLVYDATRPAGQEVDSTLAGRDYYDWRYGPNDPMRYGPMLMATVLPATPRNTPAP